MSFPDMRSLMSRAEVWKFRQPEDGETEAHFRAALADFVQDKDPVESMEIRTSVGWDQFNERQQMDMLERQVGTENLLDILTGNIPKKEDDGQGNK
jgi:hypothetical protein